LADCSELDKDLLRFEFEQHGDLDTSRLSNVAISPGNSQSRIILFNTNFFGLSALRTVVAKSVTLVEDYSGPFYYAFHRAYTNPDGFTSKFDQQPGAESTRFR